ISRNKRTPFQSFQPIFFTLKRTTPSVVMPIVTSGNTSDVTNNTTNDVASGILEWGADTQRLAT
ncbi:MAG: hypothetical protein ACI4NV_09145, partial [Thermoguttaceae bacterium]